MDRREFLRRAGMAGGAAAMASLGAAKGLAAVRSDDRVAAARRKLAAYRIVRMEVRQVQDRFGRVVGPNSKGKPSGTGAGFRVRRVHTDGGATGWAMSHWKDEQLAEYIGARVSDLFDPVTGTTDEAMKLDVLLHDLTGNILGEPVWKLIGGTDPKPQLAYTGAIYFDDLMPLDAPRGIPGVLASCRQDYNRGFRAFKLKMGRGFKWMDRREGLKRDIEVTRAVREAFADCRILVDANDGWTVKEACEYVRGVADCGLYWIEEPFTETVDGLTTLRETMAATGCKALIADGERRQRHADPPTEYGGYVTEFTDHLYALGAKKLVDVILWDLGIVGFTRWRRIMPKLRAAGLRASPHTWVWTPRGYYAAQLAAGLGNVPIVEGIPGGAKMIDYSAYKFDKTGRWIMPTAPGFGLGWVE